ncbi:MAG: NAD-dependent epimerase/dehydratase family protein [Myxococcota bacterium]
MDVTSYRDARVVVTGGAGFLGSHLAERLVALGAEVVVVDDLSTGALANLAAVRDRLRFVRADIATWSPSDGPVDVVFNLACPASPVHYRRLDLETLRAGSLGADRMLHLAVECGATFVQASTSEVYGDPEVHPQPESYWGRVNPVGPRSMYDESKRFTEALCAAWARRGAKVRVARIFNTYGPRLQRGDGRVVPTLVGQALAGEDLTVHGDGTQTRSFGYVSDLVEGLLRLGASEVQGAVNLGSPRETSIAQLARQILVLTRSTSRLAFQPRPADDPGRRCPDITRARRLLGWQPLVSLREGLASTIAAVREGAG